MVVAGELPDTLMATTADQPSLMAMVAVTGDMDVDIDMETDTDMAIAVGDFRGLRPPFFEKISSRICGIWCFVGLPCRRRDAKETLKFTLVAS
jgi:hypothetical protein